MLSACLMFCLAGMLLDTRGQLQVRVGPDLRQPAGADGSRAGGQTPLALVRAGGQAALAIGDGDAIKIVDLSSRELLHHKTFQARGPGYRAKVVAYWPIYSDGAAFPALIRIGDMAGIDVLSSRLYLIDDAGICSAEPVVDVAFDCPMWLLRASGGTIASILTLESGDIVLRSPDGRLLDRASVDAVAVGYRGLVPVGRYALVMQRGQLVMISTEEGKARYQFLAAEPPDGTGTIVVSDGQTVLGVFARRPMRPDERNQRAVRLDLDGSVTVEKQLPAALTVREVWTEPSRRVGYFLLASGEVTMVGPDLATHWRWRLDDDMLRVEFLGYSQGCYFLTATPDAWSVWVARKGDDGVSVSEVINSRSL